MVHAKESIRLGLLDKEIMLTNPDTFYVDEDYSRAQAKLIRLGYIQDLGEAPDGRTQYDLTEAGRDVLRDLLEEVENR